jgi:CHASE3 domain sensor protein
MAKEKKDILVITLVLVVVLLIGFVSYMFLIKPAMNAQVVKWANQGYGQAQVDMINSMLSQLQQKGYVLLPTGEGNETIALVVYQGQQSS